MAIIVAGCSASPIEPCADQTATAGTCVALYVDSAPFALSEIDVRVTNEAGTFNATPSNKDGQPHPTPIAIALIFDDANSILQTTSSSQVTFEVTGKGGPADALGKTTSTITNGVSTSVHVDLQSALSDPSAFCADFCAGYADCIGTVGNEPSVPLFCTVDPSVCPSACLSVITGLGESQATFLQCGNCVVAHDSANLCDETKAEMTGSVTCANSCSSDVGFAATNKFYSDFTNLYSTQAPSSLSCTGTGRKSWPADDAAIGHKYGQDNGNGSWSCTGICNALVYGPYATLPPGTYLAGVTGVTSTGNGLDFDVTANSLDGSVPELATLSVDAAHIADTLTMSFTIDQTRTQVQVRMDSQSGTVVVGGIFIERQ